MRDMPLMLRLDELQPFQAVNLLLDPGYLPGPKIIPNTAMVRLNWSLTDGRQGHNVMYFNYTGSPALSVAMADNVFAAASTGANWNAVAAHLATTTTFTGVTLLDIRSTAGAEINSTGAPKPGTTTGVALPDEVAVCITLRTGRRGQSGRGRIYIPGWASSAVGAGGVLAAAVVTALQTWATSSLFVAINQNAGAPVLALPARQAYTSPITGRNFPARDATNVPITSFQVRNNTWDSQRRRGLR